jgi:hypothetical protein
MFQVSRRVPSSTLLSVRRDLVTLAIDPITPDTNLERVVFGMRGGLVGGLGNSVSRLGDRAGRAVARITMAIRKLVRYFVEIELCEQRTHNR